MTTGHLLARNSALNLLGQALPLLLAVMAIPLLVHGLGADRFGVLTLAWAAIGYFGIFELGLSRALTQAVAHRLGSGSQDELPVISWTALTLLFVFGVVGGAVLAAITPLVVTRVLNIPAGLERETIHAFWILAAVLPLVIATVGLRGLMEAHQHFGAATLLRIPLVVFTILGPVLILPFSKSLVAAVSVLAVGRVIGAVAHLWVCLQKYPFLKERIVFRRGPTLALLRFGTWTTLSNVVSPMMVYLDRFVIGAMLTVAAVTYYVTPYEVVVKLLIIPLSLTGAVLPAFASTFATDSARMTQLYEKSLRAILLTTFPVVLVAVVLARESLQLWLGPSWPVESAIIVQWLAVGVFVSAIAQSPFAALQSAGRPDLIARLHVAELPLYLAGLVLLTRAFGLRGVAMAWSARAAIDAVALIWMARRQLRLPVVPRLGGAWPTAIMLAALAGGAALDSSGARVIYAITTLAMFVPLGWRALLTAEERSGLRVWLRSPIRVDPARAEEPI